MPTVITGTDGINQVQAGAVESGDLPAGSVIQVVNSESSTTDVTTNSTSYQNADMIASITPSLATSNILILITFQGIRKQNSSSIGAVGTALFKDNSLYKEIGTSSGFNGTSDQQEIGSVSASFLDSPSTTNEVTYEGKFKSMDGSTVSINRIFSSGAGDNCISTITLMEIAG